MAVTSKIVTYEEWLRMPVVEDCIEEVVNGEIRIMPPNKEPHSDAVDNLAKMLLFQCDSKEVRVKISNFGLIIRRHPLTARIPDLAVYLRKNMVKIDGYVHSAPELLVEVLSPGNTPDEIYEKLRDYESIGTPEVWLVNTTDRSVEVLLIEGGRLHSTGIVREGTLTPTRFPQAIIEIDAIWQE